MKTITIAICNIEYCTCTYCMNDTFISSTIHLSSRDDTKNTTSK